jgi:4-carboxymuconolactone decarboxylase
VTKAYTPLDPAALTPDQKALYDSVLASPRAEGRGRAILVRDDGTLTGPFDPWMRSPVIGLLLERAGMALRSEAELPPAAREIAILVVARAWNAEFEWWVHSIVARAAGVPIDVIDAIGRGEQPTINDPISTAAHDIASELVHERSVSPGTRDRATVVLGERGVVEVVMNVGFYQLVSATLETFHPPGPSIDIAVPRLLPVAQRSSTVGSMRP